MADIKKGDILEGVVADLASGGEGVIKVDGFPVFVPFAIAGEKVRARVTYVKKDVAFGELVEVIAPSEDRVKPVCPYFGKCGGCDIQHMRIPLQAELKRGAVQNAFRKVAGMCVDVQTPISGEPWEYRNKLALPFAYNKTSGRVSLGFFERRSHKVVPIKWCAACGEWSGQLIEAICAWANKFRISVYDETSGKGLLRHAVARMLDNLSLTLVINGDEIPHMDALIEELKERFDDFCLYVSPNKKNTNVIFGDEARLVFGEEKKQNLGTIQAVISPKSFLQVNGEIRDKLYDGAASALLGFEGDIVELYSGTGILTAQLATRLKVNITAVEIESSATRDAVALTKELGLEDRVKCVNGDALHFMLGLGGAFDKRRALLLDPPRKGCAREVLEAAIKAGFDKIVYISCDPQTLARDAAILKEHYAPILIQPYDMFPQTAEIETLCVFEKKS